MNLKQVNNMNIKTIIENIEMLACDEMSENGIHHDDMPDHEGDAVFEILETLAKNFECEDINPYRPKERIAGVDMATGVKNFFDAVDKITKK